MDANRLVWLAQNNRVAFYGQFHLAFGQTDLSEQELGQDDSLRVSDAMQLHFH